MIYVTTRDYLHCGILISHIFSRRWNWFCKGPQLTVERANPLSLHRDTPLVEDLHKVYIKIQIGCAGRINAAWAAFFMYDRAGADSIPT